MPILNPPPNDLSSTSTSEVGVGRTPLVEAILEHWSQVLPGMTAAHQPYDHACLEGFFPDDVYRQVLENLPAPEFYQALNTKAYARADGKSTRDMMTVSAEGVAHLDERLRTFWTQVGEALTSDILKRYIFQVLKQDIALRLSIEEEQVTDFNPFISTLLIRDSEQYKIKPHPDGFPRLVTMMLYLPKDMSQQTLGTSVYVREPLFKQILGKKYREVKRFPFLPNSAAAFAVNNLPHRKSLHGRELIEAGSGERNVMIVTWFSEMPDSEKSDKLLAEPVHYRLG